jgi:5-methylthioadenosine/S-adenosylhomocysteine deaminase
MRGDVAVRDGVLESVGGTAQEHPGDQVLEAAGMAVLPGLIQSHVHLCQTLMRGMAEELPLLGWLQKRVWPLEAAHNEASLRASAELGVAELLLGGTTCILDMGTTHSHDVVFEVCEGMGIRAVSGKAMMDAGDAVPSRLRETAAQSLAESDRLLSRWHGAAGGRLRYGYAPRFVLSCTEGLIRGVAERARDKGVLMHTHASEHAEERAAVRAAHGAEDFEVLESWGMSGPLAVLVHMVQAGAEQLQAVARHGSSIVHCPTSNMKLGSGMAAVSAMLREGIAVGIGADGAPCNNNLDAWSEMRHASLLAKLRDGPASLPAAEVLRCCTLQGARVLGLQKEIGSLEVGKRADLLVVAIDGVHQQPAIDVVETLVHATRCSDVRHVLVDGRWLVRDGELTGVALEGLKARAAEQARALKVRAGLG